MRSLKLLLRVATVGALMLLLMIPLQMIRGVIHERGSYRQQAVDRVAQSSAGEQRLLGPIRVVPFTQVRLVKSTDEDGNPVVRRETQTGYLQQAPVQMQVQGVLVPETRKVGLYKVPVFTWKAKLEASFEPMPVPVESDREYGQPFLAIGIADVRGLRGTPLFRRDGKPMQLEPGTGELAGSIKGLHASLPALVREPVGLDGGSAGFQPLAATSVDLELALAGTESLSVVPVADSNRIAINSTWPHPSFAGRFLPNSPPQVDANGFNAEWNVSSLASDAQTQLLDGKPMEDIDAVQVSLVDPVDAYTLVDRASKYGVLFVVLTFVGFALFELLKRLPIHPLQYLLVGLALAIFFLLLLSLSEHIEFLYAYLVSAVACIGLQFVYLSGVLKSGWRAAGFATLLTLLYGMLYGLLKSEDNALLMGSLMLFGVLAGIMWVTRKLDWYDVSNQLR